MDIAVIKNIPKNIKKYRLANKLTQEQLAEKLNLDTQYYAQLERGERNFSIEKIITICRLFHIDADDIIEIDHIEDIIDTNPMVAHLIPYLEKLTPTQLDAVEKFIIEFIPYIK